MIFIFGWIGHLFTSHMDYEKGGSSGKDPYPCAICGDSIPLNNQKMSMGQWVSGAAWIFNFFKK